MCFTWSVDLYGVQGRMATTANRHAYSPECTPVAVLRLPVHTSAGGLHGKRRCCLVAWYSRAP